MSLNVYQAVLIAANHIEKNPDDFRFQRYQAPDRCGSPGCALGWIGFFGHLGRDAGEVGNALCEEGDGQFYDRMSSLTRKEERDDGVSWRRSAALCAKGMRRYAEKHLNYYKPPVWAAMLDREAQARVDTAPAYDKFRKDLQLESIPQGEPGNTVPSNEPAEDDEVL